MSSHSLTNFEKQKYYQNDFKFKSVYSKYNLSKIKDGTYVINLNELKSIGTHWIDLYLDGNNIIHFDGFGVEHIPKEIKHFIGNTNIITNIYKIQTYNSILCGHFCIKSIDFMLKGKSLLGYINLFSPDDY